MLIITSFEYPARRRRSTPWRSAVVFLLAAIATGDQGAGDGCDLATAREDLVENDHADAHSGAERLRLGDMAEIVVGELMGQHPLSWSSLAF